MLPKRSGLVHRDSLGCKMSYGDGAVQWMTAGRGMLHEEMWDVDKPNEDFELYQLWVNLPPQHKFTPPRCQLLTPQGAPAAAAVEREGRLSDVRRAEIPIIEAQGGKVTVRLLAGELDGVRGGAETFSPMTLAHVELWGHGTTHSVAVPVGWTCFAYVRRGKVRCLPPPLRPLHPLARDLPLISPWSGRRGRGRGGHVRDGVLCRGR